MNVRFVIHDDHDVYEFETNDVAGVIAAAKESDNILIGSDFVGEFDSMTFNFYHDENDQLKPELVIYFKEK